MDDLRKSKAAILNIGSIDEHAHSNKEYRLLINPRGKPRMVRSDSWKKRKCVVDYWKWKDALLLEADNCGLLNLPGAFKATFHLCMPDSWSKRKKELHDGQPHLSKPDADNLLKALQDCLCKNDSHIYDVHAIKKWSYNGWIKIETL